MKGIVEVICFPDLYGKNHFVIQSGKPSWSRGRSSRPEDARPDKGEGRGSSRSTDG